MTTYNNNIDIIKYITLNAYVSGPTQIWNTDLWRSPTKYADHALYNPIIYGAKIGRALMFYKQMLIKRQKVLLLGSIELRFRLAGPFSHLFLTSIWTGGALTNYRKLYKQLGYFGTFLDILYLLESTQYNRTRLINILKHQKLINIPKMLNVLTFENKALNIIQLSTAKLFKSYKYNSLQHLLHLCRRLQLVKKKQIYLKSGFKNKTYFLKNKAFRMLLTGLLCFQAFKQLFMLIRHNKTAEGIQLVTGTYSAEQLHIMELKKYYDITFSVKMIQNFNNIWGHGNKLRLTRYPQLLCKLQTLTHSKLGLIQEHTTIQIRKRFFKKHGNQFIRLKRVFPAINIALDLRLANMYILNESRRLYIPLISFHKSNDPARGHHYTIPAHLVTRKQIHAYTSFFLGLVLKQQTLDLKQLLLWRNQ